MLNRNCNNYFLAIAISIVIGLILTLLYYNNLFINIYYALTFSLILAIISFIILAIFGSSDNGFTRNILCQNSLFIISSIIGNIFFNLLALITILSSSSILSTILVGFSLFFLSLNLIALSILFIAILKYA
jgi:hypothetical protein